MPKKTSNRVGIAQLDPRILPSNKPRQTLEDEFHFADETNPEVARQLADYEDSVRHVKSSNLSKEELRRLEEENTAARKAYRWPKQEDFKMDRVGKILHSSEFIRRLKRALPRGIKVWLTERGGMPGTLGLYVGHPGILRPETCNHEPDKEHYVGFVQVPFMQEYEELHFDKYDIPLGSKRRGWRTVLLKLIEQKIITEQAANREFGEPATGPVSLRYREYLHYLRSKGIGLK